MEAIFLAEAEGGRSESAGFDCVGVRLRCRAAARGGYLAWTLRRDRVPRSLFSFFSFRFKYSTQVGELG